jgi:signal peptidase I
MNWNPFKKKETNEPKKKKSVAREWLDAGVFALVAATIIRTFTIEPFTIPTGSMQGSLLINDFLFVSKMHYGPRIPMTPLSFPLVHNELPLIGGKSYSESVQWKYRRLPGFSKIERYDDVVFNYPEGDTIIVEKPGESYYDHKRNEGAAAMAMYTIDTRPVDKMDNYIKRCVALPGDKLEVKNGELYINDAPSPKFNHLQLSYFFRLKPGMQQSALALDDLDISPEDYGGGSADGDFSKSSFMNFFYCCTTKEKAEILRKLPTVDSFWSGVYTADAKTESTWPHNVQYTWNRDNFGPIVLPKKGDILTLNTTTLPLYERLIRNYEGHTISVKDSVIYIDNKPATSFKVEGNYYWMMGDNRHNSLDSRYWGYVPETHIVGKAWFIWMSYRKGHGIRWNRLFRGIKALEK